MAKTKSVFARKINITTKSLLLTGTMLVCGTSSAAIAGVAYNVPAQDLTKALGALAEQADVQLLYDAKLARNKVSAAVRDEEDLQGALNTLLHDSNLSYDFVNDKTILIKARDADKTSFLYRETSMSTTSSKSDNKNIQLAQASPSSGGKSAATSTPTPIRVMDEVVVTTRKREERLQDVPISISAFSALDIEKAGMQSVEDIARMTPGFTFTPLFGGDASTPVIRGLSTTIGEPNVGFFVDGVYQSSRAAMDALLSNNIARVEVAKGPQSALYGRNTFGGAINFVTKRPSDELEGQIELTGGEESRLEAKGSISGPIVQGKLFARAAISYMERDGYFTNSLTGEDLDDRQTAVYAASLEATPTDNLSVTLRISYENTDDGDDPMQFVPNNIRVVDASGAGLPPSPQIYDGEMPGTTNFAVTPGFFKRDNVSTSLALDYDFNDYTLTSITGYNNLKTKRDQDNDFEARSIRYLNNRVELEEYSQELRITSPSAERLRWMMGAYYYNLDVKSLNRDLRTGIGLAVPTFAPFSNIFNEGLINQTNEKTENFALFAAADFDVTQALQLSLSGRYSWEEKEVSATDTFAISLASATYENKASFENFTPRVSLDYRLTDDAMVFASISRAVKAGGFNVVTVGAPIFDEERTYKPEKSWHYEVGAKTSFLDNLVTLNAAAFYIEWQDQIVRAVGASNALLNVNAGSTTSKGFELDLSAQPVEGLDLSGGFAFTDSEYDDYFFASLLGLGYSMDEAQLAGTQLQYVSKYTANGSVQYSHPIDDRFSWFGRADISYQSKQSTVQPGDAYIGGRTLVNVRTGIETEKYSITFWVDNLFKEDAAVAGVFTTNPATRYDTAANLPTVGFQAFGGLVTSQNPQTWGVTARAKF